EHYVVVAAFGRGLVDGNAPQICEVHARHSLLDVVQDDTPQTRVVLSYQAGCRGDGHGRDKRHGEGLEQESEAGTGPCPRHIDETHAAVAAVNTCDARMQEGLVLEEIQMPPGLLDGVVHRAARLAAIRTREAAASLEIDLDVEPLLLGVEVGRRHHPRWHQAECELEQIDITHGPSPLAPRPPLSCRRPRGRQGQGPHGRAIPRVLDRRSTRRQTTNAAGTKGWLLRGQTKGLSAKEDRVSPDGSATQFSEEALYFGIHEWTAPQTSGIVDARFIALVDTTLESP